MQHDELRALDASYVLDALSDDERQLFEQHLEVCPECAGEVASLRATASELAYAVPARRAPASLRARVLDAIERVPSALPQPQPRTPQPQPQASRAIAAAGPATNAWWLAAAAVLGAILVGGYALTLRAHIGFLDQELREARAQAQAAQRQLTDAQAQLARAQIEVRRVSLTTTILASPDVIRVDLKGQPAAPSAIGRAFWSRSRGVLFTANALPLLPASKVYQLWILPASGDPLSAGLLTLDPEGRALVVADAATSDIPKGFAVTVEPAGGVPAPTGAFALVGTH
jgi:anti-sigma-K factor RskA